MTRTRWVSVCAPLMIGCCLLATALAAGDGRKVKKTVPPQYPPLALKMRVEGVVTLEAVVDADGNVAEVKAVSGHALLRPVATECLKQWQYEPAAAKSVESVNVSFKLPD